MCCTTLASIWYNMGMKKPQPLVFDEIAPMLELITDTVMEECKKVDSLDPKVRERAEEGIYELGLFSMKLMDRLYPMYLRIKWMLEHAE